MVQDCSRRLPPGTPVLARSTFGGPEAITRSGFRHADVNATSPNTSTTHRFANRDPPGSLKRSNTPIRTDNLLAAGHGLTVSASRNHCYTYGMPIFEYL